MYRASVFASEVRLPFYKIPYLSTVWPTVLSCMEYLRAPQAQSAASTTNSNQAGAMENQEDMTWEHSFTVDELID